MANTQRYAAIPPWVTEEVIPGVDGARATIQVADLRERFTGRTYQHGAYRVVFSTPFVSPKPRGKSFYGETAWNDSRRYAEDQLNKIRMEAT